jgi:erythromycin esterase-like protein
MKKLASKPVSVLIPEYNSESFIRQTIDSILSQTFKDFELLLMDDGSTDSTAAIIKSYTDTRIRHELCSHDYVGTVNRDYLSELIHTLIMLKNKIHRIIRRNIVYIFALLCFYSQSYSQSSCDKLYNLCFNIGEDARLKRWALGPLFSGTIKADSTELIGGKYPTVIENYTLMGRNDFPVRLKLQQQLLLPDLLSDTAEVSITYKNLNIKQINLTVSGLDRYENLLYSDTLFIPENREWTKSAIRVPLRDVIFLCLYVDIQGIDTFCIQRCWLDRMTIKINGKNIESFQPQSCMEKTVLPEKEITPLSFSDTGLYHSIPELKSKRIFALGETVHGSETFAESAFQLIKHQVQYNNCKLILLELPIEQGLSLNRYVQGDESFEIDSLVSRMKYYINVAKYRELLLWLKEYNRHAAEPVWLMGMDSEIYLQESCASLFDYLYTINQAAKQPLIDTLCHRIIINDLIEVAASAGINTKLQSITGKKEYDILVHCLNVSGKADSRSLNSRMQKRDSVMFENTRFLMQLLCKKEEKIFVYAHLGHTNYKPSIRFPNSYNVTLGLLMKQAYGEDYFVTGLFAGSGYYGTQWKNTYGVKPMSIPPSNSFEYLLNKISKDYFYLSALPECPTNIRLTGNGYTEDAFEPVSLGCRIDAAIYIRENQASTLSPDALSGIYDSMERYIRCFEKFPRK